ncbi:amino acid ABC transporter substrate-binding protein [Anaerolineae bacterium CFX9]|nr:amino acid ABC transporter substrate-binding protein [Anaerolineae bacterium CFX9]
MKRLSLVLGLAVLVSLLGFAAFAFAQDASPAVAGPITEAIRARGQLICGVNANLPGFGAPNDAGDYVGFDVDICRAVAAAILGDSEAVTYRPLSAAERQPALASGEVDMISRNTTWTLSRDTTWGATFGPTTFYDGQGVMVRVADGIRSLEDLEGATICTNAGTTTELNITDAMASRGLAFDLQTFQDAAGFMGAFYEGRCDAVTTDVSGLLVQQATSPDPGALMILDERLSKEPLGPLSPQSDPQFADIIRWTVYGLIQAEEFGITSANVQDFLTSDNPDIQRFLGTNGNTLGSTLTLENDFMVTVISQVGNYGEIFDRHLGPDTVFALERGINALWTDGGLLYSMPFR